ncbi:NnrU family protein [Ferrimonas balearica]|uniref:NnrU family protein n=1 Tax=Ferrimonas balearica TaxID=44012 RepID=UPI001F40BB62|nr:NnrU family protein [Ferrimonas balearica]MBY6019312.1 NnrU family protein [Halomonas denitrificans]MBY6096330.1 NnrU family protein [Ferrimonas balearica]
MLALTLGMAAFIVLHLVPGTALRDRLSGAMGEPLYKGVFTLLSAAALVLVVWGKGQASYHSVWVPPVWTRHLAPLLMLASCYLMVTYLLGGKLKGLTPNPMLWSVVIWALAHLLANGDLASLVLFGGFIGYSLLAIWRSRSQRRNDYSGRHELLVAVVALTLYVAFLLAHPYLFGVAVMGR